MKERESFEKCHAGPVGLDIEYIEDESGGFYSDREVQFMYEGFKAGVSYAAQGQYLRPMSTAPKDGTQIIVVGPENDKRWAVCWDDYNKNWPTHNSWFEEDEPIGWIPIEYYASPMPQVPEGYQLVPLGMEATVAGKIVDTVFDGCLEDWTIITDIWDAALSSVKESS